MLHTVKHKRRMRGRLVVLGPQSDAVAVMRQGMGLKPPFRLVLRGYRGKR